MTVITKPEAKVAALQDEGVSDQKGLTATGTTTDAVIAAAMLKEDYSVTHQYMGVRTQIGNALGRVSPPPLKSRIACGRMSLDVL